MSETAEDLQVEGLRYGISVAVLVIVTELEVQVVHSDFRCWYRPLVVTFQDGDGAVRTTRVLREFVAESQQAGSFPVRAVTYDHHQPTKYQL